MEVRAMNDIPYQERQIKKGWCSYPDVSTPLGGDLILTDQRLIFVPFAYHVLASPIQLRLENIQRLGTTTVKLGFGLTRKGLLVGCVDRDYRFIVNQLPDWEKIVTEAVTVAHAHPVKETTIDAPEHLPSPDLTRPSGMNVALSVIAVVLAIPFGFILMYAGLWFIVGVVPQLKYELYSIGVDRLDVLFAIVAGIMAMFPLLLLLGGRNK
jgi:hypothetical protein